MLQSRYSHQAVDRYWKEQYSIPYIAQPPIQGLTFIICKYWCASELIAKYGIGLVITNNCLTAEFPHKTPSHTWDLHQSMFFNMNCVPVGQKISWCFEFAHPYPHHQLGLKSIFVGVTNNTEFVNSDPEQQFSGITGCEHRDLYFGYQFTPRAIWEYSPKNLRDGNRFNVRSVTVKRGRFGMGDWNNQVGVLPSVKAGDDEDVIIDLTEEKSKTEANIDEIEWNDGDTDLIHGTFRFQYWRSGDHVVVEIFIAEFPNQYWKNKHNGHPTPKYHRIRRSDNELKNMGLAVTIPCGSAVSLISHHFGDARIDERFPHHD